VVGAYEIYADAEPLEASIAERKQTIWIASAMLFAVLWVLLMLLARNASGMLRGQTTALRERSAALSESYHMLEESSVEAIESLNATVEAKDPYTAGHRCASSALPSPSHRSSESRRRTSRPSVSAASSMTSARSPFPTCCSPSLSG
jgi:hypothetical protein